ncbi:MAG: threonine synthase [Candidatus Thermoplasmatota archaeon]|nr:threonine synthase [Candidatus Thermoplasmatota archaeon]
MNFLQHLECTECGKKFSSEKVQTICEDCDAPLFARYDLKRIEDSIDKEDLRSRYPAMWRYREFLPILEDENIVSLGEGFTPIHELDRLGRDIGIKNLFMKDGGVLPTGTFKSRGLAMGVSKAKELGIKKIAMPSAGNAAGALATYGSRAGIDVYVIMPKSAPEACIIESYMLGADVFLVEGLLPECGKIVEEGKRKYDWFSISTTKEPYRVEGKKTMGLELAEQFSWELPDAILYPTGGGTGLIGMWKAFTELREIGWIEEEDLPRMIPVQAEGCSPIVEAFHQEKRESTKCKDPETIADGIQVPKAFADRLILEAVHKSSGTAVSVNDENILKSSKELGRTEGVFACPEGAATLAGAKKLLERGSIEPDENILLYNTGTGLKYINTYTENLDIDIPVIDSVEEITVR